MKNQFKHIMLGFLLFLSFWSNSLPDLLAQQNSAIDPYRVLPVLPKNGTMVLDFINNQIEERLNKLPESNSRAEWIVRSIEVRKHLLHSLGLDPLPARSPLNARITGRKEYDDYILENIVFESRPFFYVTANLYIPKGFSLPAPGVLFAMGHAVELSKASEYQRLSLLLVKNGYVVLAWDPIGQGERMIPGNEHWLGFRGFMVNQCLNGFMVWDAMRALDYLLTRSEVDSARIGCTGYSGGGTQTLYLSALDPRISAAVPGRFMNSYEAFITAGVHCVDNHVPGVIQYARESDIAALVAPRAFVSVAGTYDWIFPIWGTRNSHAKLDKLYALLGIPDQVMLSEYEGGHGYIPPDNVSPEIRYAPEYKVLLAMNKYLYHDANRKIAGSLDLKLTDQRANELYCLKDGQFPQGAKTYGNFLEEKTESLPPVQHLSGRKQDWERQRSELVTQVEEVLGCIPKSVPFTIHSFGTIKKEGYQIEKVVYVSEPGIYIPCLVFLPDNRSGRTPAVVYITDKGKQEAVDNSGILRLINRGYVVFAPDLRGYGETTNIAEGQSLSYPSTTNYVVSINSVLLGCHITGMRVYDILQGISYLINRHQGEIDPERIICWGNGIAALECLFAASLNPSIKSVVLEGMPLSYKTLLKYPSGWSREDSQKYLTMDPGLFSVSVYLPNVLLSFDTPQLAALLAPRPVLLANLVDVTNQPVLKSKVLNEYNWTDKIYKMMETQQSDFSIVDNPSEVSHEFISQWIIDKLE